MGTVAALGDFPGWGGKGLSWCGWSAHVWWMQECSFIRNTHAFILQIFLSTCYVCPEHNSRASISAEVLSLPSTKVIELIIMDSAVAKKRVISGCQGSICRGARQSLGSAFQDHPDVLGLKVRVSYCHGEGFIKITRFSMWTLVLALLLTCWDTFKMFASLCLVCFSYKQEITEMKKL